MIIKCYLDDGSVIYKEFNNQELKQVVDVEKIKDFLEEQGECIIESWSFSNYKTEYSIDIRQFMETDGSFHAFRINYQKIKKFEFIEANSYEHLLGALCLEKTQDWNYQKYIDTVEHEPDYEEDPYSDDPPDYDDDY